MAQSFQDVPLFFISPSLDPLNRKPPTNSFFLFFQCFCECAVFQKQAEDKNKKKNPTGGPPFKRKTKHQPSRSLGWRRLRACAWSPTRRSPCPRFWVPRTPPSSSSARTRWKRRKRVLASGSVWWALRVVFCSFCGNGWGFGCFFFGRWRERTWVENGGTGDWSVNQWTWSDILQARQQNEQKKAGGFWVDGSTVTVKRPRARNKPASLTRITASH